MIPFIDLTPEFRVEQQRREWRLHARWFHLGFCCGASITAIVLSLCKLLVS